MSGQSLTLVYRNPSATAYVRPAYLRIEQEDWAGKATNFESWLTKQTLIPTLYNMADLKDKYDSACNEDGSVDVGIRVYLSDLEMPYQFVATRGTLGPKSIRTDQTVEQVTIDMASSIIVDDAADDSFTCAHWVLGEVYNGLGHKIIPPPSITANGRTLSWVGDVVGTLRYGYTRKYHRYTLHIDPDDVTDPTVSALLLTGSTAGSLKPCTDNESTGADLSGADALKMRYQSTVIAIANGAVEWMDVETPELGGYCDGADGSGDNGYGETDADGKPIGGSSTHFKDSESCVNRVITVDPCTGEVLSDSLESAACEDK